jgi:flagellar basal-body rod protein FlgC
VSEFGLLATAADGMSVQRAMLDVAARNVAAAQASTPTHPYARLVAQFSQPDPVAALGEGDAFDPDPAGAAFDPGPAGAGFDDAPGTRFVGATPGGETADALTEMIAVLEAQRAYEANASVFDVGKRLAERTLDVGRF